jgi:hypothetical protein
MRVDISDFTTEYDVRQKDSAHPAEAEPRKTFIKPEISVPVDVLEATTFFQGVDSGITS